METFAFVEVDCSEWERGKRSKRWPSPSLSQLLKLLQLSQLSQLSLRNSHWLSMRTNMRWLVRWTAFGQGLDSAWALR